jgi:hypothetical protein
MIECGASPREQEDLFEHVFGKWIISEGWNLNIPIQYRNKNDDTKRLDWMLAETDAASWGWDREMIDKMMKEEA